MSALTLVGTVLVAVAFIAVMAGATRMDVHGDQGHGGGHGDDHGNGGDDAGYWAALHRVDETASSGTVVKATSALAVVLLVVALATLGPLEGVVAGAPMIAVFVLLIVAIFVGSYGAAKQQDLGTAHALATGLLVAGLAFAFLITFDLVDATDVVR